MNNINTKYVYHISHTNIFNDGRIRKELDILSDGFPNFNFISLGLADNNCDLTHNNQIIRAKKLFFRSFKQLQPIRIPLIFLEWILYLKSEFKKNPPILIHAHDFSAFLAVSLAKTSGVKVIYDAHELESHQGSSMFINRTIRFLERLFWNNVNALITVSPSIANWYHENVGSKPTTVLYNIPVQDNLDKYGQDYLRLKFTISSNKRIFIHSGNLGRGRGIPELLSIFEENEFDGVLVFLGFGQYIEQIKNSKVYNKRIFHHEPVAPTEVVSLIKSADCGIVNIDNSTLNLSFALPNKIFEYLYAGLFILSSNGIETQKLVKRYGYGATVNGTHEDLKKSIIGFANSKTLNLQNPSIPNEFSYDTFKERILELYITHLRD